jgi:hypothetical protein
MLLNKILHGGRMSNRFTMMPLPDGWKSSFQRYPSPNVVG